MSISVGSICYIVGTAPANAHLLGRVVEVIGQALPIPERGGIPMHRIDAPWLRLEYPRRPCYAAPAQLRPIAAPDRPPLEQRKREPEPA